MRSDDTYKDDPDNFSREVGEKLREHRIPVDPDLWDSLTDKFTPIKRRVYPYWPWAVASMAAVALVLLWWINPFPDEPLVTQNSRMPAQTEQTDQASMISREITDNIQNQNAVEELTESSQLKKNKKSTEIIEPVKVAQSKESSIPVVIAQSVVAEPEETIEPEEIQKGEGVITSQKELPVISQDEMPITFEEENPVISKKELAKEKGLSSEKRLRSLIASVGSGGSLWDLSLENYNANSPLFGDYAPGGESGGVGSSPVGEYNLLSPEDYTDIEHRLPLSFSLTADFPIGKNVSMETGLTYTYLFSRLSRNDHFIYRGTLQQHYLGIPVNLKYTVWHNDAWKVYLFGGGSIEKGLYSVYKQQIERNGGVVFHTNVHNGMNGFQLSAQGGAGFSYRLRDNLALFGEPRMAYYFQNNQPMSARTENPLIFGLNMGIRVQFK